MFVTGKNAKPGAEVQVYVNDLDKVAATAKVASNGEWSASLKAAVPRGAKIWVSQKCDDKTTSKLSPAGEAVTPMDLTHANLIGLAPFGIVMSQQASNFSQADPFGGFIIGYMSAARHRYICRRKIVSQEPKTLADEEVCHFRTTANLENKDLKPFFWAYERSKQVKDTEYEWEETNPYKPHLNLRFQGIFESDGRTASAPVAGATGMEPKKTFIASLKTFDLDMHAWYEWRFFKSPVFHWGPYAAIGGSFALNKNEVNGEGVTAEGGTGQTDTGQSVPLDTRQVVISSGGKLYYEGGLSMNLYSPDEKDSNLYVQSFIGLGHYQAFADLRPSANTKFRGIGKLRVFPFGLNRDFFARGVISPMFGVDLNAGKGPDQVKFFIGTVLNITKFIDKLKGAAPTASNP
jgi:hypothetical protein